MPSAGSVVDALDSLQAAVPKGSAVWLGWEPPVVPERPGSELLGETRPELLTRAAARVPLGPGEALSPVTLEPPKLRAGILSPRQRHGEILRHAPGPMSAREDDREEVGEMCSLQSPTERHSLQ